MITRHSSTLQPRICDATEESGVPVPVAVRALLAVMSHRSRAHGIAAWRLAAGPCAAAVAAALAVRLSNDPIVVIWPAAH